LKARYALARSAQLAAALEQVLAWTVQHAGERQQSGRPLGKFQAIQMELAEMAGEVTAVTALTDAAVQSLERGAADFVLAAAAAKGRAGTGGEGGAVPAGPALTRAPVQSLERGAADFVLAAAAAKVRAGTAVEVVARLAHQVHGAIGFTQEYRLHHLTRGLWAWGDEAGPGRA